MAPDSSVQHTIKTKRAMLPLEEGWAGTSCFSQEVSGRSRGVGCATMAHYGTMVHGSKMKFEVLPSIHEARHALRMRQLMRGLEAFCKRTHLARAGQKALTGQDMVALPAKPFRRTSLQAVGARGAAPRRH